MERFGDCGGGRDWSCDGSEAQADVDGLCCHLKPC